MKKSDVIKAHPELKTLLNTIERGKLYRVHGYKNWDKMVFRVTHFYKPGIRAKALNNPIVTLPSIFIQNTALPIGCEDKWTFNWDFLKKPGVQFTEVLKEDLPLIINDNPTPYFKESMGHTLNPAEVKDYSGEKNNPYHRRKLLLRKFLLKRRP
jgi:hypothetical protein